jgi:hypothetical protein
MVERAVGGARKRHRSARSKNRHYSQQPNHVKIFPRKKHGQPPKCSFDLLWLGNHGKFPRPDAALSTVSLNHSENLAWLAHEGAA